MTYTVFFLFLKNAQDNVNVDKYCLYQFKNYNFAQQVKNNRKGGGLYIYIHDSFSLDLRQNLRKNSESIKYLTKETANKES